MAWAHGLVQISIHSAARAETLYHLCQQHRLWYFNPLRREGGDPKATPSAELNSVFQSTPPRGRRQSYPGHGPRAALHFNPLRREGGDEMLVIVGQVAFISIHSAARAETISRRYGYASRTYISIHSAARAETNRYPQLGRPEHISIHSAARAETTVLIHPGCRIRFQSTPPRGRSPNYKIMWCNHIPISIHSAARAETKMRVMRNHQNGNFNPLRREGGDASPYSGPGYGQKFQSTPPRGRRPKARFYYVFWDYFNPLRREGGDPTIV